MWSLFIKSICAAVIFVCTMMVISTLAPLAETRYWPVVSKLTVEQMVDNGDGTTNIYAFFNKLRDCEYVNIAWYRGRPDGMFERASLVLLRKEGDTSSPNRPTGQQRSGPWILGIPADQVKGNSFARLTHRCWPAPFWLSTTDFYP